MRTAVAAGIDSAEEFANVEDQKGLGLRAVGKDEMQQPLITLNGGFHE